LTTNDLPKGLHNFFAGQDWLNSHLEEAPNEIMSFLRGDGIQLQGIEVLDLGTGDGLIAKSFGHKADCNVTGIDVIDLDWTFLEESTKGICSPNCEHKFNFRKISDGIELSFANEFDLAISWSAAEHIMNFQSSSDSVFSSLRNGGIFFLQTYPLWRSSWGHHLSEWLPPFFHLQNSEAEVLEFLSNLVVLHKPIEISKGVFTSDLDEVLAIRKINRREWIEQCADVLQSCNRINTLEIQKCLTNSGFVISKVKVISQTVHIPHNSTNLLESAIDGIQLLAFKP
jgi:SAM-dependent methyltransferase